MPSRTLACCQVKEFEEVYLAYRQSNLLHELFMAAVDTKTSCQGLNADGESVELVTMLIDKLKFVIA
jgi:hypothetical protein